MILNDTMETDISSFSQVITSTFSSFQEPTNNMPFNNSSDRINTTGNTFDGTRDETLAKVEIGVLAAILFMALFGNLVVIVVLLYRKRKLSRMQMFIIHLCIADISVGLFQVLPQLVSDITYRFDGNNFLCKLVKYMQLATMYSSTYVLIMTAIDRYMSICNPLTSQTWTTRRVHVMVLVAWVLSSVFAFPQLFIFSYKPRYDGVYDCLDNFDFQNEPFSVQAYITWIFLSVYAIPLVILTACYTKICHAVWISARGKETTDSVKQNNGRKRKSKHSTTSNGSYTQVGNCRNPRAHSKKISKSKIKTVKLTLVVVLCFVICWAPFFITQVWSVWDPTAPYFTSSIMAITTLLSSLNSCTNPWIYLAFSGRLCKKPRKPMTKTWMSSANTYMTETGGDTMRMRTVAPESDMSVRK